jgi:mannosyltransferase OCH1-like enzyme
MIPKIIWQTSKDSFDKLPQYAKDAAQTWKNLNPEYEYVHMDDEKAKSFIIREFGEDWLKIFNSYPLGVMRGDLWRYMIIYIYGGVYADLDTICVNPIDTWINKDKDLIICIDDDNKNYAQLAFAAKPKNITIKNVLDLIKEKSKDTSIKDTDFVSDTTGVNIWTKGVKMGMLNEQSIYCYNGINRNLFHDGAIKHLGWSTWLPSENYISWQQELNNMLKETNA